MRTIPDPGFRGDDGSVAPEVESALAAYDEDPGTRYAETLALLQHSRLLVPVVAVLGAVEHDEHGLAHDKTSDMATVLMRGRDGRLALLAFTGSEPMRRWDPQGRPVPVSAQDAARAALQDQAEALVVDVAGPVVFVIDGEALHSLAEGFRLTRVGSGHAWAKQSGDAEAG